MFFKKEKRKKGGRGGGGGDPELWLEFGHLPADLLQIRYNDRDRETLHLDISLHYLDLHSRSHLYEKARLCTHLLANFLIDFDEIGYAATTCFV